MSIQTVDQIAAALANNAQTLLINKASLANQTAGGFCSLWRATGQPGQGAIPTGAAILTNTTLGAMAWNNPTAGNETYIGRMYCLASNASIDVQIHDRLAHMGGLSGIVTTAQPVNIDLTVATSNLEIRKGDNGYSDVQWWIEVYTDMGATAVNATVAVTYDDNSTGNLTAVALGATPRASRLYPLVSPIVGRFIRAVTSVTLSATTGTAGNFGITATRFITNVPLGNANTGMIGDWALLGLPKVPDFSCLFPIVVPSTTTSGTILGNVKLIAG